MEVNLAANEKAAQLMPWIEKAQIKLHIVTPETDSVLLRWWIDLKSSGEIDELINKDAQNVTAFMALFQPPTYLLYTLDSDHNILQAHWFKAVSALRDERSVFNGLWCHANLRGSRTQLLFTYLTYRLAFCFCTAIIGTTWQPNLIVEHIKMGYDVVGLIPDFAGHEQFYFVRLTEERFTASKAGTAGYKLLQRMAK